METPNNTIKRNAKQLETFKQLEEIGFSVAGAHKCAEDAIEMAQRVLILEAVLWDLVEKTEDYLIGTASMGGNYVYDNFTGKARENLPGRSNVRDPYWVDI